MIRQSTTLSVLLCVYNGKPYLGQAVKSILAQSYADFELVLVDDGSTDGAVTEIKRLQDKRIKIISKENTGLTDSLNIGLQYCTAEYIARHDADDMSLPERFEQQIQFLQKNEKIAAVGTAVKLMDDDADIIGQLDFPTEAEDLYIKNIHINQFMHGCMMFRKSLLQKVGGYRKEFIYAQDYDLTLRCQEKALLANLPQALYLSRFGSQRISVNKAAEQAAIANMARTFAKQRRNQGADAIQEKQYDGDYMRFSGGSSEQGNNQQILLYLYLRAGFGKKARRCIRQLFTGKKSNRIKLTINYLLSFLPKALTAVIYSRFDNMRHTQS